MADQIGNMKKLILAVSLVIGGCHQWPEVRHYKCFHTEMIAGAHGVLVAYDGILSEDGARQILKGDPDGIVCFLYGKPQ